MSDQGIKSGDRVKTPSGEGVLFYHAHNGECIVRLDSEETVLIPYGELERA